MPATFEELRVLKEAEKIADGIWKQVVTWKEFDRDVVGKQFARAVDSIGANIAESYGRYHFGEKLQFLYFARGSLFESKYWLNRTLARGLLQTDQIADLALQITGLARHLNAFANGLKEVRLDANQKSRTLRELASEYVADIPENFLEQSLFSETELTWLAS